MVLDSLKSYLNKNLPALRQKQRKAVKSTNKPRRLQLGVETLELRLVPCVDPLTGVDDGDHDAIVGTPGLLGTFAVPAATGGTSTTVATSGAIAASPVPVPAYSSRPGAGSTLYLNFGGENANGGNAWGGSRPAYDIGDGSGTGTFSAQELANIQAIWQFVADGFAPFNINVTTVAPAAAVQHVSQIDIGGDNSAFPGFGGVAEVGGMDVSTGSNPTRGYVFSAITSDSWWAAAATMHEAGHTMGLLHQNDYTGGIYRAEYYNGPGDGTGPIMGGSGSRALWWYGTVGGPTRYQDDLAGISDAVGYAADDAGDTAASAAGLGYSSVTGAVNTSGVISTMTPTSSDLDYWAFATGAGTVNFTVAAPTNGGTFGYLEAKFEITDASGNVVVGWQDSASYSTSWSGFLNAGSYRIVVASDGISPNATSTNYGFNVGKYTISGSVTPTGIVAPEAPNGLAAAPGDAQVGLSWYVSSGASSYNVYRGTSGGGETLLKTGVTDTSYTDSGLTNGTTYYYQVTAVNALGQSGKSSEVSATPIAAPIPVYTLSASPSTVAPGGTITVNWTAPASRPFTDLVILYDVTGTTVFALSYTTPFTSGSITFTAPSTPGAYQARFLHNYNNGTGTLVATSNVVVVQAATNQPPTVATPASANQSPVTGTTTNLSVLGADDGGEASLTYTWTVTGTPPAAVTFSANDTNAAKNATATFTRAGTYDFQVTIRDAAGLTSTSNVSVNVNQTLTSIAVSPASATVADNATQQFTASGNDQFGNAVSPTVTWSVNGLGTINASTGLYTAPSTGSGSAIVTATSGSLTATASVSVTGAVVGTGTGLTGQYFANQNLFNAVLTRTDATVNFDWGGGSPDASVPADHFSARWTGQVQAQVSETYTFYTTSDDGVRLWVNGQLIIDNWTDHGPTENSGTIALVAGQKYDIKMEFYENGGGAAAKLFWSSPSTAKQAVPTSQLYGASTVVVGTGTGLTGQYFSDQNLTNAVLTRTDATVNFDWGGGAPDASVPADHFSARWTGQVQAQFTETYTFYTVSDDGVRLWVNGQLIINNWTDHSPTENSGTIALVAGQKYDIKMEFYENGGGATAKLFWSSPSTAKQAVPTSQLYGAGTVIGTSTGLTTGQTLGRLRNDFSGWVGGQITVGASNLTVTDLGRIMVAGNSGFHIVKLVYAATGLDVSGGAVAVFMLGGVAGEFKYATLSSPVTLLANHGYYLVSQETAGGDQWQEWDTTVTTTAAASLIGAVWANNNAGIGGWNAFSAPGHEYGPVDLKYASSTSTASASFVKTDTTTQGNWNSVYGGDGYNVSQDATTKTPSYAQVSFSNQSNYTLGITNERRSRLAKPENLSDRIAGTWYTNGVSSFTIDVNLTDGNTHQVALYALDWDSGSRAQTIKVLDAGTGTVLDSQTLSAGSFHNGEYLVWNIKGHVKFEVDYNGGYNAVISGLFFGGASAAPATPVTLTSAFNRTGIVSDGSSFGGGFDSDGFALSANLLGSSVTWNGNSFNLGAANTTDVISAAGQTINLPTANFSTLNFLAAGVNGNQPNLTFTVTYTDGSTQTFTQSISDWYTPQNYSGESQAVTMAYRDVNNGGKDNRTFYIYGYSFALNSSKTVQSITLPNAGNVELLAMTLS